MSKPQIHPVVEQVTQRVRERSASLRGAYLQRIAALRENRPRRQHLGCANLAHTAAAVPEPSKRCVLSGDQPVVAIVTAFNDMLSAHQPFETYPATIKRALVEVGAVGMVAGGVPAMCDGVTQGFDGMELSLFSRDIIAMSTAVALSHDTFDAGLCLGVCDKIVPGLLIGALSFGHLPFIFVPAGPMRSGISNQKKSQLRVLHAEGKIGRAELLEGEAASYHSPGTCTFFGTANSNQMMMEMMGLHLPGASFVNPDDPLREALTTAAAQRVAQLTSLGDTPRPLGEIVDERAIINACVGLLATGGSTNHTIHLLAIARAAGILLDWDDLHDLSSVVPLLARVYPNGQADVNAFHAAGGLEYVIRELLHAGFLHGDIATVYGEDGLWSYAQRPQLHDKELTWAPLAQASGDLEIVRPASDPFATTGGLVTLEGNLGRAVIKVSAVAEDRHVIRAPAKVFSTQAGLQEAFKRGELESDFVAVVRFQGPRANGMPELHKLTPPLTALQKRGFRVALVTDGRMSGASGQVPAGIHLTPEAQDGGPIARIVDGDIIVLDAVKGELRVEVPAEEFAARPLATNGDPAETFGCGRELFAIFRDQAAPADQGASPLFGRLSK